MNIRIHAQQLRFRVTQQEFDRLKTGQSISEKTCLPGGVIFVTTLIPQPRADSIELIVKDWDWTLRIPTAMIQAFANSLPAREGIEVTITEGTPTPIAVSLEVDVRKRRE